jgi:hypothetical protein
MDRPHVSQRKTEQSVKETSLVPPTGSTDDNAKSVSVTPFSRVPGDFDAGGLQAFQVAAFSIKRPTAAECFFCAP